MSESNSASRSLPDLDRIRMAATSRAASLLAHKARMAGVLVSLLTLAGLALAACGGGAASRPTAPRCADLVAHAITTQPPQPVVGSYACLAPNIQAEGQLLGITDDASFAAYEASQSPAYTAYRYIGKSAPNVSQPGAKEYYYFQLTPAACYRVSLDSNGLVDGGGFAAKCPNPLP